jgi:NAD(P)-dependent dehydrogenase (short-subunit alcohol dehydrogenase family)
VSGANEVAPVSWRLTDLPDQTDRTTVVTGCTVGGLGFHVALELARRGGRVVLAGRSSDRLAAAEEAIRGEVPDAALDPLVVDVSDLTSVRLAGSEAARFGPLHCLVNNAGIMATPYARTSDGFEQQLATNHLGPFLLTGLLLPQLVRSGDGRVVAVSSQMHRAARRAPLGERRDQARQPAVHLRARASAAGGGPAGPGHGRAPRILRHPPGRQRPVRALLRRWRLDRRRGEPGDRPVAGDGRAPAADGRHGRPAGWHLLRSGRPRGSTRPAAGRRHPPAGSRRGCAAPALDDQ